MNIPDILSRASGISELAYKLSHCNGRICDSCCDSCNAVHWCNQVQGDKSSTLAMCSAVIDDLVGVIESLQANQKVVFAYWKLVPGTTYEGEEDNRYVCSHCGSEAPFGCDEDGFATL